MRRLLKYLAHRGNGNAPETSASVLARACDTDSFSGPTIDLFWSWAENRCPTAEQSSDHKGLALMAEAVTTADQSRLAVLATSRQDWVRFASVNNPNCPPWAVWGDGQSTWGLAEDPNLWVRAAAVISMPSPPASVLEAAVAVC